MLVIIKKLAEAVYDKFANVSGVGINFNPKKTNLIMGENTEIIAGEAFIEEKLCDKIFKVGANTFFQVNPVSAGGYWLVECRCKDYC